MRVLVAEKFQPQGLDQLRALGCEVVFEPDVAPEDLPALLGRVDPDVLIVRGKQVTGANFERPGRLSLVIRAGAGYDSIDVAAASSKGVFVANCPGKNAVAVAELAWGLIIACDRRIPQQTGELREGKWNKKEYSKAQGLYGRTLGIVGVGTIGREVIARGKAFGMDVVAWSRSLTEEKARGLGVAPLPSAVAVARHADVVSLHVASTPETERLVDEAFCEALRPGAILVNTTRGKVVDEAALLAAVREKQVRVGLDVYQNEPGGGGTGFDSELAREPLVVGTHHVGASTEQAQNAIADEAVRVVRVYRETGQVENCVNRAKQSRATRLLTVRHLNRPGVLAHVVGAIGKASINIEEMENIIYQGGEAACARVRLDTEPDAATLESVSDASHHVLSVDLTVIEEGSG